MHHAVGTGDFCGLSSLRARQRRAKQSRRMSSANEIAASAAGLLAMTATPRRAAIPRNDGYSYTLENYDYHLPADRIAQVPSERRDQSKLLVLDRLSGGIFHRYFYQVEEYFTSGDVLVLNDSRVMKSRLYGRKPTGGKVEILLLSEISPGLWNGLVRNVGWDKECTIRFDSENSGPVMCPPNSGREGTDGWQATVLAGGEQGVRQIRFNRPDVMALMESHGLMPLPPYIKRSPSPLVGEKIDNHRYQTVYANDPGSAAAPTAGLHFTKELLNRLKEKGVSVVTITLHVGYGTFQLIEVQDIRAHKLHSEYFQIGPEAARTINDCRARVGKLFAVGTTVVRTLENAADETGRVSAGSGWNSLYIYGEYRFKVVDHLITNFHLPKSSLLVLAASFAKRDKLFAAYEQAIQKGYRFYSYGDAMLIL